MPVSKKGDLKVGGLKVGGLKVGGLKVGDRAPVFTLPAGGGEMVSLKDMAGKKVVLYFYPKDDTPGCTTEACAFNAALPQFRKLKTAVFGVSKDSAKKHEKFAEKYGLSFPLLSDEGGDVLSAYGVWVEKSMYGRKYMGIERSTFLIDESGKIARIWRAVKVTGHVDEVREAAGED